MRPGQGQAARKYKALFMAAASLLPVLVIVIIEFLLNIFSYSPHTDPYVNITSPLSIFSKKEHGSEIYCVVDHPDAYRNRQLNFTMQKPADTLRVFCIGGSASAGWPHPPEETYSEYLKEILNNLKSDKKIEIINVSANAFASYRVKLVFDDVMRYDPDLIVVYSGNNEFIEKRKYIFNSGIMCTAYKFLAGLRTVQFLRARLFPENTLSGKGRSHYKYSILSKVKKIALELRKDPVQFERLKDHYKYNMEYMARAAEKKDIPIFFLTVPVNLRDWHPNVSFNSIEEAELSRWKEIYREGEKDFLNADYNGAVLKFKQAASLDPVYAESYFYLARAFEKTGDKRQALEYYHKANDMDHNPFRAISYFNNVIRSLTSEFKQSALIDLERLFIEKSGNSAPGFNLFLDYVHPNVRGNMLIAKKISEEIIRRGILKYKNEKIDMPLPSAEDIAYDENKDERMQMILLWLMGLMHQYDSMLEKARADLNILDMNEEHRQFAKDVIDTFSRYNELMYKKIMRIPVDHETKEKIFRRYNGFYQKYYLSRFL